MTAKFRIEGSKEEIQQSLNALRGCGANITGVTGLYGNRNNAEQRLYCVVTFLPDGEAPAVDRVTLAKQARDRGDEMKRTGDGYHASYYYGLADGLET